MQKNWKKMQTDSFNLSTKKQRIVSYMSGSSDEYLAFTQEVMIKECQRQISLVKYISDVCKKNNVEFILRVHPNTRNKCLLDIDLWNAVGNFLISRGQKFFPANSNINTYSIVDKSDLIITNGSTITVESCLQGKNVCLCGFSGLREYKAAQIIKNIEELEKYILHSSFNESSCREITNEAKKYLLDELKAGRTLKYYSMENQSFKP